MFQNIPYTPVADSLSFFLRKDVPASSTVPAFPQFPGTGSPLGADSTRLLSGNDFATHATYAMNGGYEGIPLPLSHATAGILFLIFMAFFVVSAFLMRKEGSALYASFKSVLSSRSHNRYIYKEQITTGEIWGEIFLILQTGTLSTIVLFMYSLQNGLSAFPARYQYFSILVFFVAIGIFFAVKYLLYRLFGYLLNGHSTNEWTERYFRLIEIMGVIVFIPALVLVYLHEFNQLALHSLIIIFFIGRIVIIAETLYFFVKNKVGFLYFIAYLCGVEFVPYLYLYKGAVSLVNIIGSIAL
ncbi:MAG TPA: hypothetical protein DDZ96_13490 [Porphyromonadaceae bacterium]|nr:hypothetical protein [Porphyromonadaceae bacterium]HBL34808.1 hypothetical protein [Porphyromonadaceae bacterium]